MAKNIDPEMPEGAPSHSGFFDLSRKILLASIGAAVLAQEEVESFVNRLVQRGELAEIDARRLIKEVIERREKIAREKTSEVKSARPAPITKADIEALSAKIAELNRKIEELKKE